MEASKPSDIPTNDSSMELSIDQSQRQIESEEGKVRLIDIREEKELVAGGICGALHLPMSMLASTVEEKLPDKEKPVILYCATGSRSLRAASLMKEMGYRDVKSMAGGFKAWVEAGRGIVAKGAMGVDQVTRYSRQMLLTEVGEEGQLKLLRSKVLIVGAGGLGSPVALYLAAGGIGSLGIVDFDTVGLSNIHRQLLHNTGDVGRPKTESAMETLRQINPDITAKVYQERFTADNALKIVEAYDVIVDGSDNMETKFLLNDAAFFAGKPYVFGGAVRFDGQASVFFPREGGPCLRCMIPRIPPPGTAPTWSEVGVLGIVPGQIGLVQAAEVLKLILGIGKTLMGRFLVYDCLEADFRTFAVKKNPACPLCAENPSITNLSGDYGHFSLCNFERGIPKGGNERHHYEWCI